MNLLLDEILVKLGKITLFLEFIRNIARWKPRTMVLKFI